MKTTVCALALACCLPGMASAVPLVVNGSFETGDFTGWTVNGPMSVQSDSPFDGVFQADFNTNNDFSPPDGSLSQVVATTPGTTYTLSFALGGSTPNNRQVTVDFGGTTVFQRGNPWASLSYGQFFVPVTATSNNTLLTFTFSQPGDTPRTRLDFVSLEVPELAPTQAVLPMLIAFALMGVGERRRRPSV